MLQVNNKTNELLIYDVIGEDWFGGGITAKNVIAALDEFGGKRVTVRINSPGGVADEGIAIYNALKRYEGRVDTVIDSIAASAASVIALAGEKRTTSEGGRWMIHRAMAHGMNCSVWPHCTRVACAYCAIPASSLANQRLTELSESPISRQIARKDLPSAIWLQMSAISCSLITQSAR
jgi:hypothetical protein